MIILNDISFMDYLCPIFNFLYLNFIVFKSHNITFFILNCCNFDYFCLIFSFLGCLSLNYFNATLFLNSNFLLKSSRLAFNFIFICLIIFDVSCLLNSILVNIYSFIMSFHFNNISLRILYYCLLHDSPLHILHSNANFFPNSLTILTFCDYNSFNFSLYFLSLSVFNRIAFSHCNLIWLFYNICLMSSYCTILLLCHLYDISCCFHNLTLFISDKFCLYYCSLALLLVYDLLFFVVMIALLISDNFSFFSHHTFTCYLFIAFINFFSKFCGLYAFWYYISFFIFECLLLYSYFNTIFLDDILFLFSSHSTSDIFDFQHAWLVTNLVSLRILEAFILSDRNCSSFLNNISSSNMNETIFIRFNL